jgi:predicted DNA-binding transcriptional regulator AlpA
MEPPLDAAQVARLVFGRSRSWFYAHLPELRKAGFPEPDDLSGRWDREDLDAWRARRRKMRAGVEAHVADRDIDRFFGL